MSDPEIKRVVLACDASCEVDVAVREATALAAKWRVPLHGIFIEDQNLRRLADLPFTRQVSLSSPDFSESLASQDFDALFSALAAGMRRALAAAAADAGLEWSFSVEQDIPGATTVGAGDILVLEAGPRPFSGSWRPRSRWESVLGDFGSIVLLRRGEGGEHGRVVIVLAADKGEHARTFAAVRALRTPANRIAVIAIADSCAAADRTESLIQAASEGFEGAHIERVANISADIDRYLAELKPALVVIETAALESEGVRAVIARTQCDVLLVG